MTEQVAKLNPIRKETLAITIVGTSQYVAHAWTEKALRQMRDSQAGRKTKDRQPKNPEQEARDAAYCTADGEYGIPAMALKSSMVTAAHKDLGIEKTLVRKALFLHCDDPGNVLPIKYKSVNMREDPVRVGRGGADLRYRLEFHKWTADLVFEVDRDLLTVEDVVNLLNRAGFGVGVGEWRPEKGGEWGRFEVATVEPAALHKAA